MPTSKDEVIARWSTGLPKQMLNKGHKPGRSMFHAIVGWLLLDWFIRPQVKIETVNPNGGGGPLHMVGIVRFGEAHSFILNDNAVMSFGVSVKHADPHKIVDGFVIREDEKIGVCCVPKWAVGMFLEEFIKVYMPTVDRFNAEMAIAMEEGKPADVTIH